MTRTLRVQLTLILICLFTILITALAIAEPDAGQLVDPTPGGAPGERIALVAQATVNFQDLARHQSLRLVPLPPLRAMLMPEFEAPEEPVWTGAPTTDLTFGLRPLSVQLASPSPSISFQGLDDIPMVDSNYIVIPPDVAGAVGPTRTFEGHNNNYRVLEKSDGSVVSTMGTATFWAAVAAGHLAALTDPRILYDPYNNRWIACMLVADSPGMILLAVSQTSDPAGSWYQYAFTNPNGNTSWDFPNLGFNRNWIAVTCNRYSSLGVFQRGSTVIASYPDARAGTLGSASLITQASSTHFCSAPCATMSATQDTLFVVTHLASAGATYEVDVITGTASPTYTSGGTLTRPGGGWKEPSTNQLPQSAPNSGASACSSAPCKIENQDAQIRTAPVYRNGYIWYAQTIGLPSSGYTHTAVQWTQITPGTGAAFVDGGRIEDPTATATNGGMWYAYPDIAVNSLGDFVIGYTQFSSAQHPSAGYSYHDHTDPSGTVREPQVYKPGVDYYHKTFSTTNGRNRWGDFSQSAVDPTDDMTLWTLQEYAEARASTDDGNTGTNGSRWSTWWAAVSPVPATFSITASAGAGGSISPSGTVTVNQGDNQGFTITPEACYNVADVLVDGSSVGSVTSHTFTDVQANHTISASFALRTYTVTASAGPGGGISPSGAVSVNCGADQGFAITPDPGYHVLDVLVNGGSLGPVTAYTFTNVTANHTIAAGFSINTFIITASHGPNGTVAPPGVTTVDSGGTQAYTITPSPGYAVTDVLVDGVSQGPLTSYTFSAVSASHTISATFRDATPPAVTVTAPNGGQHWGVGENQAITWTATDNEAVDSVNVDYSVHGADGPWARIQHGIANSGSLAWLVPGPATDSAQVRVTAFDHALNQEVDASDSVFSIAEVTAVEGGGRPAFALHRPVPNPSRDGVTLRFSLARKADAAIEVVGVNGALVWRTDMPALGAGEHSVVWNGRSTTGGRAPTGLYFVRLRSGGEVRRSSMVRLP